MPPFRVLSILLPFALLWSPVAHGEKKVGADALGQPELQAAFDILRTRFVRSAELDHLLVNRSALAGLLERLGNGATLVSRSAPAEEAGEPDSAFHSDILGPELAYLRPSAYSAPENEQIDLAMQGFRDAGVRFLILDLRVPRANPDLEATARFLDRFVPPDSLLFRIQGVDRNLEQPSVFVSKQPPHRWRGGIVLLLDGESSTAGELIAATILRFHPAFTVGEPTPGETVEFEDIPLNDDLALRVAVAEILLPNDESLFRRGIAPSHVVTQPLETKRKVYAASAQAPLSRFVFEQSRPRLNEAALVHSTNPELEYHLARARGETTPYDVAPLVDKVLQRAVDLVITLRQSLPPQP